MPAKAAPQNHAADAKEEKFTLRLSVGLLARIRSLAERKQYNGNAAEVVRIALRQFIDQQEDIVGSKAHFQYTLRERFDELEQRLNARLDAHLLQTARLVSLAGEPTDFAPEFAQIRAELDVILHMQTNTFAKLFGTLKPLQDSADPQQMIDAALQSAAEQYTEITSALHQLRQQI